MEIEGKKKRKRQALKVPRILTKGQVYQLFDAIKPEDPQADLMFLKCLFYLALRVSECINLTKDCFDDAIAYAYIKGKGGSKITKEIPAIFKKELKHFLSRFEDKDKLFNFTRVAGWQKVKRYAKKAGLPDWIHPHTLRHTVATILYQPQKDLKLVQDFLGHKDSSSTLIYTHISTEEKRKAIDEALK